ncbi:translation initiation factor eIF-2B subunit beta [Kwoniella heveanensis CBS 569]|uniref:Translation initiation factor eIF2B subunit beta n=1 Tax=Kwoniella heveanensis BCC8398 TaxID=1296120 RepID=A0A1B9GU32_9TREE|nr:translation initiation factor eIF-2B subunit beta [Kwoniella heveanensis BCC8398]OCF40683.1 translation initiation factor eIF-2B subunit beta [Kwoniella heveanensis CBS 569]
MVSAPAMRPNDPNARLTEALCTSLRRRQIVGSLNVALATAAVVQNIVRSARYSTIDELLGLIKMVGRKLIDANPKELAAANIIRRILRLIREEYRAAAAAHITSAPPSAPETPYLGPSTPGLSAPHNHYLSTTNAVNANINVNDFQFFPSPAQLSRQTSLSNFVAMRHSRAQLERSGSLVDNMSFSASTSSLFASPTKGIIPPETPGVGVGTGGPLSRMDSDEFMRHSARLKPVLIQAIDEVVGELETTHEDVAKGAREHIHSSEIILTMGHSKTVEAFLKQAYRDRKFTVVVAESAPSYLGHSLATSLSSSGIPTILIPDSSIHALLPRVTKVILGAHSVLANGGLFALSGSLACALAAKSHSKPVVITTGQFKFAPAWNLYHEYGAVDFQSPGNVLGTNGNGGGGGKEGVEVVDPYFDYIRPDLVNLFVTNE